MRLGLDLDNTILKYEPLFHKLALQRGWIEAACPKEKEALKSSLVEMGDDLNENRWQQLQALVYGENIDQAEIFPGFSSFMAMVRHLQWEVFIISHKSHFSHKEPTVDLHYWARNTLKRRGFFQPTTDGGLGFKQAQVIFCPTREEKIATITSLKLDGFIDDLPAVLNHPLWPENTHRLLIHSQHESITSCVDWYTARAIYACRAAGLPFPLKADPLKGGGNNRLTSLSFANEDLVHKAYHDTSPSGQARPTAEWRFLQVLAKEQFPAPRPRGREPQGVFMTRINGSRPDASKPGIAQCLSAFLIKLDILGRQLDPSCLPNAAHARFRPFQFVEDLTERVIALKSACIKQSAPIYNDILAFLNNEFAPQQHGAISHFQQVCSQYQIHPETALPASLHFPSPSDFGPHNCLEQLDGSLVFLDFEYAGWDDPAKLLCDILYHVGSGLSQAQRLEIVMAFIGQRINDPKLQFRMAAYAELIRLEWIAIVLNVVRQEELARKCFAGSNPGTLLEERLDRALRLARTPPIKLEGKPI